MNVSGLMGTVLIAACLSATPVLALGSPVQEKRLELPQRVFERVKGITGTAGASGLRNIQAVTMEQLLSHRSGLAEYFTDEFEIEVARQPEKRWTVAESLAFAYGQPAQARPGREFSYTNTNYVLLGHLIEQADQTSPGGRAREWLPLGLLGHAHPLG